MDEVLYEVRDRTAYITLNRLEKRNAMNAELTRGLIAGLVASGANDGQLTVSLTKARQTGV